MIPSVEGSYAVQQSWDMLSLGILEGAGELNAHVFRAEAAVCMSFVHENSHLRRSCGMLQRWYVAAKSERREVPEILRQDPKGRAREEDLKRGFFGLDNVDGRGVKLSREKEDGEEVDGVDEQGKLGADSELCPDACSFKKLLDWFVPGVVLLNGDAHTGGSVEVVGWGEGDAVARGSWSYIVTQIGTLVRYG